MDKENKMVLILGSAAFCVVGFFLRSCRPFMFGSDGAFGEVKWGNQAGVALIVVGLVLFCIERWRNLPFLSAKSQASGITSISFFVLAVPMLFFELETVQFILLLAAIVAVMVAADFVVISVKKKK